jgi:hypothetical protein
MNRARGVAAIASNPLALGTRVTHRCANVASGLKARFEEGRVLARKADRTAVASIRLAGGCEVLYDLVDAGFKPGNREGFLKKRN